MTVTYAATDVCLENKKRQTIGRTDVLTALDALGFEHFQFTIHNWRRQGARSGSEAHGASGSKKI